MKKPRLSKKVFVEKIPCGRCPAMAEREVTFDEIVAEQKSKEEPTPTCVVIYHGQPVVSYAYLCSACQEIVSQHIRALSPVEKRAALKQRKSKKEAPVKA